MYTYCSSDQKWCPGYLYNICFLLNFDIFITYHFEHKGNKSVLCLGWYSNIQKTPVASPVHWFWVTNAVVSVEMCLWRVISLIPGWILRLFYGVWQSLEAWVGSMSRRLRPWSLMLHMGLNCCCWRKGWVEKFAPLQHFKVIKFRFALGSVQNIGSNPRAVAMTCDIIVLPSVPIELKS